ncbi:MAG: hypothetical protein ACRDKH_00895 [Solirubrobacterales bacterium]
MDEGIAHRRSALPPRRRDRLLLAAGCAALVAAMPVLWAWVLYASAFGPGLTRLCALALGVAAAAIGLGMIRLLDRR